MRVSGTVVEEESSRPLAGLRVRAYDKDVFFDDRLGEVVTDAAGRFAIDYTESQFRDLFETAPDVYIRVYDAGGENLLYSTEKSVRRDAAVLEEFLVRIPRARLG